jgi:hypothetical protein
VLHPEITRFQVQLDAALEAGQTTSFNLEVSDEHYESFVQYARSFKFEVVNFRFIDWLCHNCGRAEATAFYYDPISGHYALCSACYYAEYDHDFCDAVCQANEHKWASTQEDLFEQAVPAWNVYIDESDEMPSEAKNTATFLVHLVYRDPCKRAALIQELKRLHSIPLDTLDPPPGKPFVELVSIAFDHAQYCAPECPLRATEWQIETDKLAEGEPAPRASSEWQFIDVLRAHLNEVGHFNPMGRQLAALERHIRTHPIWFGPSWRTGEEEPYQQTELF